jgi:hypothetical protein
MSDPLPFNDAVCLASIVKRVDMCVARLPVTSSRARFCRAMSAFEQM